MDLRVDRHRFDEAPSFEAYLGAVQKNAELWQGVYRVASVDSSAVDRLRAVRGDWRLLALSEDWCTDAVSALPIVARLADRAGLDLRVLSRDANPDLMDVLLTCGTRSIPVIMVLNGNGQVVSWWGPRPSVLQRWMRTEAAWLPKEDRTRRKRAWYARDRGRSTCEEVIQAVERAARREAEGDG